MYVAAVDLFCGAGGLTYGLERSGISVEVGIDNDRDGKYPYERNTCAEFLDFDARVLEDSPERASRHFPSWEADVTVLGACAPCQPYSTMSHAAQGSLEDHNKWGLLNAVRAVVEDEEPDVVVTENVLQVRNDDVYLNFEERLEELGYAINPDENKHVYCPDYGIPQKRKRWLMIASKDGEIHLPQPTHPQEADHPTVRDTISHLPSIKAGEAHPGKDLHRARELSEKNLERIENMEPGGDWRLWEERDQDHLLADCHKRDSGRSYKAPYSRMRPDEPAPTITTQFYNYGSGRFGHYDMDQNRALSLLEGALLQTFPEEYQFYEDWEDVGVKNMGQLIGNAVPPRLGEVVGHAICEHFGLDSEECETELTPMARADDD